MPGRAEQPALQCRYRHPGRSDFRYRQGRVTLLNFVYEHTFGSRWDPVMEADFRHSERDQTDPGGTTDANTGGSITYLTPRILFDGGGGCVLRGSAQIPLSESGLNEHPNEESVLNVGVAHLCGQ